MTNPFAALLGTQVIPESAKPLTTKKCEDKKVRLVLHCPVCLSNMDRTPFNATKQATCGLASCTVKFRDANAADPLKRTDMQKAYVLRFEANRNKAQAVIDAASPFDEGKS